jgi:Uma2 family endonuclease
MDGTEGVTDVADHDDVRLAGGSLEVMPTLVRDPQPVEFERLLERRRRLGQDLLDEVWEGVYHMNPAPHSRHSDIQQQLAVLLDRPARQAGLRPRLGIFNLGEPNDYRVPDGGLLRPGGEAVYLPAAALVVEIVSPNDDTWDKLCFYANRAVDELLIVDPQERRVHWLGLGPDGEYQPLEISGLIELGAAELADQIDWPE